MVSTYIIISAVIAFIAVALGAAYTTGALDPVIQQIGIMFFKAKAEAEKKKLQAQGMKEGEDFVGGKSLFGLLDDAFAVLVLCLLMREWKDFQGCVLFCDHEEEC